jgi:large subunit ribosomal protein L30
MAVKDKKSSLEKTKKGDPKEKAKAIQKVLRIELVKSIIGHPQYQREVVKGLGLRKVNSVVTRNDSPETRGMIRKIPHLLKVETLEKK